MSFTKVVQKIKSEIILFKYLAKDTEGASGIEYAIIAGMAAVALAVFMTPISEAVTDMFTVIKEALVPPA
ncbi:Flp family type IVb pilin [Pseudomonas frederiksbergensis]|jgi:pilus assembly protein Flp/PilA|uniref:Pilus assembly protein n=1 Tax=Pseudomonas frederiksbergensis TaxID=104087 RepID=A0A423IQ07_9PSED|nr:Flp family type IVb pilin [Pseudomonas frederiksbergensis]RON27538.1 pilus assembly protein [Pseudomonas frederiksbergensis]